MKIKTRTRLVAAAAVIVVASAVAAGPMLDTLIRRRALFGELSTRVIQGVTELTLLTNEYLFHQEVRAAQQWQKRFELLLSDIQILEENIVTYQQTAALAPTRRIRVAAGRLEGLFLDFQRLVVAQVSNESGAREDRLSTVLGNISVVTQEIAYDAIDLKEAATASLLLAINRTARGLILALIALAAGAAVLFARQSSSIGKPIGSLSRAIETMAEGKLDVEVDTSSKDEVGDLARSFQTMAHRLTTTLASRNDLAEQIALREAAETERRATMDELERSNSELEQFAYAASHDLQEPLRVITSYLELLQRKHQGLLPEEAGRYIEKTVSGAARMKTLISDLLLYSRVTTRGKSLRSVESKELLESALDNLSALVGERDAVVEYGELPRVAADRTQMTQVFQNLIGNGLKYCANATPHIRISAEPVDGQWEFSVQDNGIGIEEQYRERIFGVFQRLHSRSEYSGTGIGLAICRKVVERHDGRIWVTDGPGGGSDFRFRIPDAAKASDTGEVDGE